MRRSSFWRNSIAFIGLLITVSCLSVTIISVLRLPDISLMTSIRATKIRTTLKNDKIGKFGEILVEMLPDDLAFTVFMPSQKAFERDLRLNLSESLVVGEKMNDTYAILSRILGFSVVPRTIVSGSVMVGTEISYDSLSGFRLLVWKDLDGMIIANGVRSERVDLKKGKIVVHVMDGVIMEAEFEQSIRPEYGEQL